MAENDRYLEARLKAIEDKARDDKTEYLRRLTELNHAHRDRVERESKFLPRESFEAFLVAWQEYKEITQRALLVREGAEKGVGKLAAIIFASVIVIGVVVAIVVGVINSLTL